jgi:IclR family transcriptional regulator, KDG regulon repressor
MSTSKVKVLEKALFILSQFLDHEEFSFQDLLKISSYNRTTLYRMLQSFVDHSFLRQDPINGNYQVSANLIRLAGSAIGGLNFLPTCRPYLKELVKETGEYAFVAILEGTNIVVVDLEQSKMNVQVNVALGKLVPAHCTGAGKALLAFLDPRELDYVLNEISFEKFTERTVKNKKQLQESLKETREKGYGVSLGEFNQDIVATGAPIFGVNDKVVACIAIAALDSRVDGMTTIHNHAKLLCKMARKISIKLGASENFDSR